MKDNEGLPQSVREWVRALEGEIPWSDVQPHLAAAVVHNIGGRTTRGAGDIVQMMQGRAVMLAGAVWTPLPTTEASHCVIRGAIPGKLLPSPGGPMSALDFAFGLTSDGLIAEIMPTPHHPEPQDLRPPMEIGARIDPFELSPQEGQPVRVDPSTADLLLVVFTCNHCPWALGWHDRLQAVARDYEGRQVRFLQVNANDPAVSPSDAPSRSQERVARGEFAGPYLRDVGQTVARRWGAPSYPRDFPVRRTGHLDLPRRRGRGLPGRYFVCLLAEAGPRCGAVGQCTAAAHKACWLHDQVEPVRECVAGAAAA